MTAAEFDRLLAEYRAADAEAKAEEADRGEATAATEARCGRAHDAIINARPTDPASMAKQIGFWLPPDPVLDNEKMLAHIATVLFRMAPAAAHLRQQIDRDPKATAVAIDRVILEAIAGDMP